MKDLYHHDVVEMIERETRQFELWEITDPDDPAFPQAYGALWEAFGAHGEMEREDAIREFLRDDPYVPTATGSFLRYFLIVARDRAGRPCGVRDGTVLVNPAYAPDLCVVYLSHLYMLPEARGTVLSYWLRIAPVELAVEFLANLGDRGLITLPEPDAPGRTYGMRIDLTAEMEYFAPDDRISWQRILFYGRGGFDVINPRHFPYLQADFRDPDQIRATGNRPLPFMILVRRMGRERQASMPIDEARSLMRLLYDDFASHCAPEHLATSLQLVLDRLAVRAKTKSTVELFPLPTGPKDLNRLRRLFRYTVFQRYYDRAIPDVAEYLAGPMRTLLTEHPQYLDEQLAGIARELERRPKYVYDSRDRLPPGLDLQSTDEIDATPAPAGTVR
ncbi:MAG: hypothetical protein ABMB14_02150 [Myxococcota bacterium]